MRPNFGKTRAVLAILPASLLMMSACGLSQDAEKRSPGRDYRWEYVAVEPGTHPGIIFSERELPMLRKRAAGSGLAAEAWAEIKESAAAEYKTDISVKEAVEREGRRLSNQLECKALVYQVDGNETVGREALEIFQAIAVGMDPWEFHKVVDSDFFATEHWPRAFAFAWDWLYPLMSDRERSDILSGLERWSAALYDHTENWWWSEAGYNCGAIPVGAHGMLLAAIRAESGHRDFDRWFGNCWRKILMNYFPETWDECGTCNEGPGYAHYHQNPTLFAEAVRRTGGPDIIAQTGAVNSMHYLRHQWMPQGGCGPVGDNTQYGRRVFQAIYLHGIRELGDAAGLWTFEKYADRQRYNNVLAFLLYPDGLEPVSPGSLDLLTSHYFQIDRPRAGHVFSRSEWDNEKAHWFVFTTQFSNANHSHTDMNSFLFTAFGEPFATHENIYSYGHEHHGADFEHNIVIINEGGLPTHHTGSAGDDGDMNGFLTGIGLGHFADYVRGDARYCYADRAIRGSRGALRADRMMIFVKQGPNPYVVVADDIQKDDRENDYRWQWFTEEHSLSGAGTFDNPFLIEAENADCAIAFLEPSAPVFEFGVERGNSRYELGLLKVSQRGVRVRFLAVAGAWEKGAKPPRFARGPEVNGNEAAAAIVVEGEGFRDMIVWQPEEFMDFPGRLISCGELVTDALMAMVRTDDNGNVTGYVLGDGSRLEYGGRILAGSRHPFSVSADSKRVFASGARQARQGLNPLPARGAFWLPDGVCEVWVDDTRVVPKLTTGRMAVVE